MKKPYKTAFRISIVILLLSNIFWFYKRMEAGLGHDYYKVSHEEYHKDLIQLKKIITPIQNKEEAITFLKLHKIEFDTLSKGTDFNVLFKSFTLSFGADGKIKKE